MSFQASGYEFEMNYSIKATFASVVVFLKSIYFSEVLVFKKHLAVEQLENTR